MSKDQALALAFPSGKYARKTAALDARRLEAARVRARAPIESRLWTYYEGLDARGRRAYAYFDRFKVRDGHAAVMAVLGEDGRLALMECLELSEPPEYRPSARWLSLLLGRDLEGLKDRRGLPNLAGATLSAESFLESGRRVAAVHAALRGEKRP